MRLPKDLLNESYRKPSLFLCDSDKTRICELETTEMNATFKFNSYSELTFTVPRTYTSMITGETQVNPFYNKIEALRLVYLENFGYFEIQDPEIVTDGIREVKNITAYGLEYTLSQKYLNNIKINTGEIDSTEVIEAGDGIIHPVTLYNPQKPNLSLLDIVLEKVYGWSIGFVDESLKTVGRVFEISRVSVYDFIIQDICEKYNCFAVFDTINNKINLYSEALITKHIGDGITRAFSVSYESISSVTIDSYRTVAYTYDAKSKYIIFDTAPADGARIEITDGSQAEWMTDVYATFDNLAQEVNISYSADDIKTVLTVKGADDMDIREVNMGMPYIVDLSYYYSVDWMGQELYDAYTKYLQSYDKDQESYAKNSADMLNLRNHIIYEQQRTSLEYKEVKVDNTTISKDDDPNQTYYVRGGSEPYYYYTKVSLPRDYNAGQKYYIAPGTCLNATKFDALYAALKTYFLSKDEKDVSEIDALKDDFKFMGNTSSQTIDVLSSKLQNAVDLNQKNTAILDFLNEMWNQLGLALLEVYYKKYNTLKDLNTDAGMSDPSHANYWGYYPVTLVLQSLESEKTEREETIKVYQGQYDALEEKNKIITNNASMDAFFKNYFINQPGMSDYDAEMKARNLMIRMSAFLREDEYTDDTFEELSTDTIDDIMDKKKSLLECGRIELERLCSPKLEFSMNMANIYALPEFEPIIDQFQLGNFINVVIRSDYIKRARLLEVNINFDDFSDFSCSFGELTNLKTPSSIHADLLASALSAGKSVASNASYWNKAVDIVTQLDLKIQEGLISAVGGIYNKDQSVIIDDMGILLRKLNEDGSYSPYQAWLRNNTILLSEDGFSETSEPSLGLGEFVVDGKTFYGILAKAILSGYIEGSTIVGGKINIGDGTFIVDEDGHVTMKASSIDGYATSNELSSVESNLSSRITVTENGIETKVSKDSIISAINQSAESVAIDANKISLTGKKIDLTSDNIAISSTNFNVTKDGKITANGGDIAGWKITNSCIDSTITGSKKRLFLASASDSSSYWIGAIDSGGAYTFYVTKEGKLYSNNAEIEGKIVASDGIIGGWDINSNSLTNVYNGFGIGFCNGASDTNLIAVGIPVGIDDDIATMSWGDAPFRVTRDGSVYATKGLVGGWNITSSYIDSTVSDSNRRLFLASASDTSDSWMGARDDNGNYVFVLSKTGKLYASNAEIAGKITATSGNIGGFSLNSYSLDCTKDGKRAIINSNSIGVSGNVVFGVYDGSKWSAYIDGAGKLVSTNADISGKITATSGTIGGCTISNGVLSVPVANITGTITANSISVDNFSASSSGVSIAGWTVDNNSIRAGTLGSSGSMWLVRNGSNSSATIGSRTGSGWCIGINNSFGVTSGGAMYCNSGKVANGFYVGSWRIYNDNLASGSGTAQVSLTSTGISHGSGGTASWYTICVNNSSDERLKSAITSIDDKYDVFYDNLQPKTFKYNAEEDGKIHIGYIAQEVATAITTSGLSEQDFWGLSLQPWSDEDPTEYYQLQRQEFIALNTWQIQKLKARVTELEEKLAALERNE